jgi:hypothetical protein
MTPFKMMRLLNSPQHRRTDRNYKEFSPSRLRQLIDGTASDSESTETQSRSGELDSVLDDGKAVTSRQDAKPPKPSRLAQLIGAE